VLVEEHLVPFLPRPAIVSEDGTYRWDWGSTRSIGKASGFWGNFLVLVRAYAYMCTMGSDGLREASKHAVLNANYLLARLRGVFEVPFGSMCMHEFVLSAQRFKECCSVGALDFAKALLDRSYHPPTMYFPMIVHEALMVEPTETEAPEALDAFADTLLELAALARKDPRQLSEAPVHTPVRRLDEVRAAKNPILRWTDGEA
jgi:glycine dehydrogenase subunit 2